MYICVGCLGWGDALARTCMWRPEGNFRWSILSFYRVGLRNQTQTIRVSSRCLYRAFGPSYILYMHRIFYLSLYSISTQQANSRQFDVYCLVNLILGLTSMLLVRLVHTEQVLSLAECAGNMLIPPSPQYFSRQCCHTVHSFKNKIINIILWPRDRPVVKSTCCFCRGPRFSS